MVFVVLSVVNGIIAGLLYPGAHSVTNATAGGPGEHYAVRRSGIREDHHRDGGAFGCGALLHISHVLDIAGQGMGIL